MKKLKSIDEALIIGFCFYALERERERVALCLVCTAHAFRTLWNSVICTVVWFVLLHLTSLRSWSLGMGPTCTIFVVIWMRLDFERTYIYICLVGKRKFRWASILLYLYVIMYHTRFTSSTTKKKKIIIMR